ARLAGFAPNYFSALFRQRQGVTFERYVSDLRVERAKQLLASSTLSVARVGELSGFSSAQYFSKVFRRSVGARRSPIGQTRRSTGTEIDISKIQYKSDLRTMRRRRRSR